MIREAIASSNCDAAKLYDAVSNDHVCLEGEMVMLTSKGREALRDVDRLMSNQARLQASPRDEKRNRRAWAIYRSLGNELSFDRRRWGRVLRLSRQLREAGFPEMMNRIEGEEYYHPSDPYQDHFHARLLETDVGPALVVEKSWLTSANTDASEFLVRCAGRTFRGDYSGDVMGNSEFEMAGIAAQKSVFLEMVGEEYGVSIEKFVPWALGHLLNGTSPPADHGNFVD
jgi:hypothetical protein